MVGLHGENIVRLFVDDVLGDGVIAGDRNIWPGWLSRTRWLGEQPPTALHHLHGGTRFAAQSLFCRLRNEDFYTECLFIFLLNPLRFFRDFASKHSSFNLVTNHFSQR